MSKDNNKLKIKFLSESGDEAIKQCLIDAFEKHKKIVDLAPLVKEIKKELDSSFPKCWVVVAGMKVVASFTFIEDTLFEFEINNVSFIVFKIPTSE